MRAVGVRRRDGWTMRVLDVWRATSRPDHALNGLTPSRSSDLPEDLLRKAAGRLRGVALIFAFGFLVGNFIPPLFDPTTEDVYQSVHGWGPGAASIALGLVVAWLASRPSIPPRTLMHIGLVFGVLGAYGIAFATYWRVYAGLEYLPEHLDLLEPGYVAPWIIAFTVVIPNKPSRSLVAAVAAASAVPVVWLLTMRFGGTTISMSPGHFFTALILPYLVVVLLAYVAAKLVYSLGTDVKAARQLGSYQLVERLGVGGMGEVWRARHRMLARPAAIKLIRDDMLRSVDTAASKDVLQRFEREAQMTALLRSPHTIDLYDFGVAADGTVYYVMELLEGLDLGELVTRYGPLPPARVFHVLRQACGSLAEAHERGLIHRDIKAANLYLCRYGRNVDFVKVLDFGLVTLRHDLRDERYRATGQFKVGGTPAYMSPEQAQGLELDERSDLYSLGCVAYWLLTGLNVFDTESALETMIQQVHGTPVPPSRRSELDIPEAVDRVVLRCLAKDPADRPQTADALEAQLQDAERAIRDAWTDDQAVQWWREHRPETTTPRPSLERGLASGVSLVQQPSSDVEAA